MPQAADKLGVFARLWCQLNFLLASDRSPRTLADDLRARLSGLAGDATAEQMARRLTEAIETGRPAYAELQEAERFLVAHASPAAMRSLCADLEARYRAVLPKGAVKRIACRPKEPQDLHEYAILLVDWLYRAYRYSAAREAIVRKIKARLAFAATTVFAAGTLWFVMATFSGSGGGWSTGGYLAVGMLCAGILGSIFSIIRRLQKVLDEPLDAGDPEETQIKLKYGQWGVGIALSSGAAFPFVLYAVFLSEVMGHGGGLFPAFKCLDELRCGPFNTLSSLVFEYVPAGPADAGKILVWSFMAGFAERLLPDVLDRLVTRSADSSPSEPPNES